MSITVRQAGIQTTVQDLGRINWQHLGIPMGGAMDEQAHRVANLLVGNEANAAALECALGGVALQFNVPALVALAGRDISASLDGAALPPWHTVRIPAGALLVLHNGCRTTIAVAGGIDVPVVLDSRSTCLRAGFGGMSGRALLRDDRIGIGAPSPLATHIHDSLASEQRTVAPWSAGLHVRPAYADQPTVRIIPGPECELLTEASRTHLLNEVFRIAPESDRMGYRLAGPPLSLADAREIRSAGVTAGTVQLPPGGAPIVLMADRQTTGGYPRLGDVIAVDLPLIAQLRASDRLRFAITTLEEAHALFAQREDQLHVAQLAVNLRFGSGRDDAR